MKRFKMNYRKQTEKNLIKTERKDTILTDTQLENCTFVKGVLLLIVIFSHSMAFWRGDWFTAIEPAKSLDCVSKIIDFVSNFHVYAFTLASGYIYYYVRYERGGADIKSTLTF